MSQDKERTQDSDACRRRLADLFVCDTMNILSFEDYSPPYLGNVPLSKNFCFFDFIRNLDFVRACAHYDVYLVSSKYDEPDYISIILG